MAGKFKVRPIAGHEPVPRFIDPDDSKRIFLKDFLISPKAKHKRMEHLQEEGIISSELYFSDNNSNLFSSNNLKMDPNHAFSHVILTLLSPHQNLLLIH